MNSRGYAMVGLWQPKKAVNVGGAMRAAFVYGASGVLLIGEKRPSALMDHPADTMKGYKHMPTIHYPELPRLFDCKIVGVEINDDALSLPAYRHPERALYLFGPEDGSLPTDQCHDIVQIPTRFCMNLAATVNVVLYDRAAKRGPQ